MMVLGKYLMAEYLDPLGNFPERREVEEGTII